MNRLQDVGAGVVEDLVAPLEAEEVVVDVEIERLQLRAHGAVADEDALAQCGEEGGIHVIDHE